MVTRASIAGACSACVLVGALRAEAAEAGASVDLGGVSTDARGAPVDDSSAFLAAGKIGGILPFGELGAFVQGGVELGWVFGGTERRMAALLDVSYTAPKAEGTDPDARVPDGSYRWMLRQKILTLQPTFLYRFTGLAEPIVPYAAIGPRIYLLESVTRGSSGGASFPDTKERSTKVGFGLPLGAEYQLGPGGLFAELLFQWGPLDHETTGDSTLAGATPLLGYRALL